jgi:hypothetical protein
VTWRALNLFVGAVCVFAIAYCVSGAETSPLAVALFRLAPPLGVALWVEADARRLRQIPCYELGAFVLFGWLVAVPWYCVWSRGRTGWLVALALIGLILAPSLICATFATFFGPERF